MVKSVIVYFKTLEEIKDELGFVTSFEPYEIIHKKAGYPNILSGMEKYLGKGVMMAHKQQIDDIINGNVFTINGYVFHIDYIESIKFLYKNHIEELGIEEFKELKATNEKSKATENKVPVKREAHDIKNVKAGNRYKLNTGNNVLIVRTEDVTKYTVIDLTDSEVILFESSWYEVIGFLYVCEAVKITKA